MAGGLTACGATMLFALVSVGFPNDGGLKAPPAYVYLSGGCVRSQGDFSASLMPSKRFTPAALESRRSTPRSVARSRWGTSCSGDRTAHFLYGPRAED
jgi:hypothetical protein